MTIFSQYAGVNIAFSLEFISFRFGKINENKTKMGTRILNGIFDYGRKEVTMMMRSVD